VTVVDAHVHLWDLVARPQPWTAQFPALQRSFLLPELESVLDDHGLDAAVVVQAGDTTGETLDLLALAATTPRLAGVVGWVDLDGPDVRESLTALRAAPGGGKLVAVRHQLQVEADPRYLARPGVRNGLTAVAEAGLAFDVVVSPWQLPLVIETAAVLPGVRFVLDHAGKPPIASGDLRAWRADLARLAELPNVAVKVSGLVTEADWATWTQADLAPVIDHVLACFGAGRTMAGSDWPVCLLAADYATVRATLDPALSRLDAAGRGAVLGGSAARWYRTGG
jgi:L-fuconolactonase